MHCFRKSFESVSLMRNLVTRNALPQCKKQSDFRLFSSTTDINTNIEQINEAIVTPIKGGFAKAFDKQTHLAENQETDQSYTFASLLRNSKLIDVSGV